MRTTWLWFSGRHKMVDFFLERLAVNPLFAPKYVHEVCLVMRMVVVTSVRGDDIAAAAPFSNGNIRHVTR